eukprot:681653-Rhodomonas_salina.1
MQRDTETQRNLQAQKERGERETHKRAPYASLMAQRTKSAGYQVTSGGERASERARIKGSCGRNEKEGREESEWGRRGSEGVRKCGREGGPECDGALELCAVDASCLARYLPTDATPNEMTVLTVSRREKGEIEIRGSNGRWRRKTAKRRVKGKGGGRKRRGRRERKRRGRNEERKRRRMLAASRELSCEEREEEKREQRKVEREEGTPKRAHGRQRRGGPKRREEEGREGDETKRGRGGGRGSASTSPSAMSMTPLTSSSCGG